MEAKGVRKSISIINDPSTIDQNKTLVVKFPDITEHDVIVPNTAKLTFDFKIKSKDINSTIYQNIGRSIIKTTKILMDNKTILHIDDSNIFYTYTDLWETTNNRSNMIFQGVGTNNMLKHRVNAGDKISNTNDEIIKEVYNNKFCIPLDFKISKSFIPFYQSSLSSNISYELTFNDADKVIKSTDKNATYEVTNICLECDIITDPNLAKQINQQLNGQRVIHFDKIQQRLNLPHDNSDKILDFKLNVYAKSIKGILLLFEDPERIDSECYYNPKIENVEVTINEDKNQLYDNGMKSYHQWKEIKKLYNNDSNIDLTELKYYENKFGLWLDFRVTNDNNIRGTGRTIESGNSTTIKITKKEGPNKPINVYIYVIKEAQINIENGKIKDIVY